jgi:hypothetical protein
VTEELWSERRPIIAMILEADSPRAFAFGKDFCFEVADDIKPAECDAFNSGQPAREDPFGPLRKCARYLK